MKNNICLPKVYSMPIDLISDKNLCTVKTDNTLKDGNIFSIKNNMNDIVDYSLPNKINPWIAITMNDPHFPLYLNIPEYSMGSILSNFKMLDMTPECFIGEKSKYAIIGNDNYFHWSNNRPNNNESYLHYVNETYIKFDNKRLLVYVMDVYIH